MPDNSPSDRFKAEMPQIPGVSGAGSRRTAGMNPAVRLVVGLLVVLSICFLGARWLLRPKREAPVAIVPPQLEVPSPAPDPSTLLPHASDVEPGIATVNDMAKAWSFKHFYFKNPTTGENVPALLVRLPTGSAAQSDGYWALSLNAPFGNCKLEYVSDIAALKKDYGFRAAKHPMVTNPCSQTVFDPTKQANLPGNVWVRGAIAQGSDLRPPLGIEVKVEGKDILAVQIE
ncbi:MAG TPA: hypothetical protein VGI16_15230 [Candidatus Acidoferrum sp.]|jgi:hypothetical protein